MTRPTMKSMIAKRSCEWISRRHNGILIIYFTHILIRNDFRLINPKIFARPVHFEYKNRFFLL